MAPVSRTSPLSASQLTLSKNAQANFDPSVHGPSFFEPRGDEHQYFALRTQKVQKYFADAMGVDDFVARVEMELCRHGFSGENSIGARQILCKRAELCPMVSIIRQRLGSDVGFRVTYPVIGLRGTPNLKSCMFFLAAVLNVCRDEICNSLKRKIQLVFGEPFNIHGLGGVITCGVTGMGAGLSHCPVVRLVTHAE